MENDGEPAYIQLSSDFVFGQYTDVYDYVVIYIGDWDEYYTYFKKFTQLAALFKNVAYAKFVVTDKATTSIDFAKFPDFQQQNSWQIYLVEKGGYRTKYTEKKLTLNLATDWIFKIMEKKQEPLTVHDKRMCLVSLLDQDIYNNHVENDESFLLVIYGEGTQITKDTKSTQRWRVKEVLKETKANLDAHFLQPETEFGTKILEKYDISTRDYSQVFIIDTSKISVKFSKHQYMFDEVDKEKLTEFVEEFKSIKQGKKALKEDL